VKVRARPEKQQLVRGRRRARVTMRILTSVCALAALGIGATELATNGLATFLDRPAGVGATPSNDGGGQSASRQPAPSKTPSQGTQPAPLPPPVELRPVVPGPRGGYPPPGFPHPDGPRGRPGPRRGPPAV
jgi:hypothetical protein